ncbi:MAG: hypothetical protein WCE90_08985 [Candidatus Zixiibacteriota bacterium]
MKNQKEKKNPITLPVLIIIIVTAIITLIINSLFPSVWRIVKDHFWPPRLQFSLTKCIIYRTDSQHFPICEMDIAANNPSTRSLTVHLKLLRFFRDDIVYRFPAEEGNIRVEPKDRLVIPLQFKDRVLDLALKVPQDSSTAVIKLTWEYVERESIDSLVISDVNVSKCTYWQRPVFDSEAEASNFGASVLGVRGPVYYLDTLTGKQGKVRLDIKVFTNQSGLLDFDMEGFITRLFAKDVSWDCYLPALRRRYGGIYMGLLASDTGDAEQTLSPHHLFNDIGDYGEFDLTGTTFEEDFSNISEFIYYTFDPARDQPLFRVYYENSKYFVLLVYEQPQAVDTMITRLTTKGYRVGAASTRRFGFFQDILTSITPTEKLRSLAEKLNTYVDSLNLVTNTDGAFVLFPVPLDSERTSRITRDIIQATGKSHSVTFCFDCRPFKSHLLPAPFSTPVLVFLNFSDDSLHQKVHSIKLEYPPPP